MKPLVTLTLCLAACGTPPRVPSVDPVDPTTRVTHPTNPTQPTNPTNPIQPTQPGAGCSGQSLRAIMDKTIVRISPDGTTKTLFTFATTMPGAEGSVWQWDVHSGYLIAMGAWGEYTGPLSYEFVMLGPTDEVVFHDVRAQNDNPSLYQSEDGTVAVVASTGLIIHTDGTTTSLGNLQPIGAVLADGTVPVQAGNPWDGSSPRSLLDPSTMATTPLAIAPDPSSAFFVISGKLVYFSSHQTLVLASAGASRELALPASTSAWYGTATYGDRYLLGVADSAFIVIDAQAESVELVNGPPDMRQRYGTWDLSVADNGTAFGDFSDSNGNLVLKGTTDDGATWTPVGAPMAPGANPGLGQWLQGIAHGDGVLIMNLSSGYGDYVNSVQLVNGASSVQLPTNALYVNANLHPGAVDLSSSGECAAAWSAQVNADPLMGPMDLYFIDQKNGAVKAFSAPAFGQIRF